MEMSDANEPKVDDRNNCIENGNYVIIQRTHDKDSSRLIKADVNKCVYLGKQRINLNGIFGHEFGSVFELDKYRELKLVTDGVGNSNIPIVANEESNRDNRFLHDDGKSQKLSRDDIEVLKTELTGTEIISNLVMNSTTFKNKTIFAQQKYLKKKQQKYSSLITVLHPNVRLLVEMYYTHGPQKINYLRIDTLSQMLTLCNVMYGGKYIIVDSHLGILTAAVLERIGSSGSVIQVYTDPGPVTTYRQAVEALNISKELLNKVLFGIQINQINQILNDPNKSETNESPFEERHSDTDEKLMRKEMRRIETINAKMILKEKNMDSLLIITKQYDPLNLLQLLYEFLALSRPFAVFSPLIDHLIPCYNYLKGKSVHIRITETWMRKYQVLPDRTRPELNMSSNGGFLLTGIKVAEPK